MLYVCDVPWHTEVLPVIVPGCAGSDVTVILNVFAVPEPHALFAFTVISPLEPAVAVIEADVELPVHPEGKVHV